MDRRSISSNSCGKFKTILQPEIDRNQAGSRPEVESEIQIFTHILVLVENLEYDPTIVSEKIFDQRSTNTLVPFIPQKIWYWILLSGNFAMTHNL